MKTWPKKYVCRGGGIRITRKGERESPDYDGIVSTVDREADLYQPLGDFLTKQAQEDGVPAVVFLTNALKARGQWQNPDITRLAIEYYRNLRKIQVSITTYEVKQFPRWNVGVVYEAASHHRFSHEPYVVLEWPNTIEFSSDDPYYKLDQIARECQRHGVGLATLHPYHTSYRLRPRIEPRPRVPDDEDVETWPDYVFSRNLESATAYDEQMAEVQRQLSRGKGT